MGAASSPFQRRPRALALAVAAALAAAACSDDRRKTSAEEAQLAQYIADVPPMGMIDAGVDFDGKVRLVGYVVSPRQALYSPGTRVTVVLVWRVEQQLDPGWQLFTHLVGDDGRLVMNLDAHGPLRKMEGHEGQPLPPSAWKPGKLYVDPLNFIVPGDPSPTLRVAAGIFKNDERLPIRGPGGDAENRLDVIRLRTGVKKQKLIKELSVPRLPAGATITIDGRLDDPAWPSAPEAGPFVDLSTGRKNPSMPIQGSARLLWDDSFFYIGFDVKDRRITGGFPTDAKDPHLWERDTVEIMIDPDGDGDNKDYYEIQVSPQNLVFDSQFDDYNAPRGGPAGPFGHEDWSAGLTSAVTLNGTIDNDADQDEGYTVEAKIPWSSFAKAKRTPPAPGDAWRMNFYAMQNNGGNGWSPLYGEGNFHRARRFGRVLFAAAPGDPAAVPTSSASAGPVAPPAAPSASAKAPPKPATATTAAPSAGKPPGLWAGDPDR